MQSPATVLFRMLACSLVPPDTSLIVCSLACRSYAFVHARMLLWFAPLVNRPQELDDAVRRRLVKRIYIPLPDAEGRAAILTHLLQGSSGSSRPGSRPPSGGGSSSSKPSGVQHALSRRDLDRIVASTEGYSASDLTALCREAALGPVRELGAAIASVPVDRIRPVCLQDFADALQVIRPSLSKEQLKAFEAFTREYGAM
jgi:spastin